MILLPIEIHERGNCKDIASDNSWSSQKDNQLLRQGKTQSLEDIVWSQGYMKDLAQEKRKIFS